MGPKSVTAPLYHPSLRGDPSGVAETIFFLMFLHGETKDSGRMPNGNRFTQFFFDQFLTITLLLFVTRTIGSLF